VDQQGLESLGKHANLECMRVDVVQEEDVKRAVSFCIKRFGGIHCMFANAGISGDLSHFTDTDKDAFDRVFQVNVNGVFYCFKHAALSMQAAGIQGSLVATSSVAGIRSGAGGTAYSASKAAVINMCQTVANQLAGTGIRCNAICPGIIETGMTAPMFAMADQRNTRNKIGQLNPLRRYAVPEEIASVAYFLASPDSSYVNGQSIAVDGGLSSSHPVVLVSGKKAAM
jgi:NAD(P)-dependent dehydrogenase (short-subunit alcohol dehydrogenase family)